MRYGPALSLLSRAELVKHVTCDEIDRALASIDDSKAPVDGYYAVFFFWKSWSIIKKDVYKGVLEFFQNVFLHKPINTTGITLVPKIKQAIVAKDFRLIACCTIIYNGVLKFFQNVFLHKRSNTTGLILVPKISQAIAKDFRFIACYTIIYKIISKIITHRMQSIMHEVFSPSQAEFIPDNILLATKLIRGYTRKHLSARCVIKVDTKKAYELVKWPFLEKMLLELGFSNLFVSRIMGCVRSVSYSILINGIFSSKKRHETR